MASLVEVSESAGPIKYGVRLLLACQPLTPSQLTCLKNHRYNAEDNSYLNAFLQPFWEFWVRLYPCWLAPNLITTVGLIANIVSALIFWANLPSNGGMAPWWCYFLCAIGLFVYQTLDATDGKQARKTQSASPLGEIFDHGCDSLSQIFVTLTACLSLQLGDDPKLILLVSVWLYSLFYAAHWQTFASGVMSFSSFDVTEGQMVVISICVASGISSLFGWDLWRKSFLGGVQLNWIVLAISAFLGVSQMWKIATSLANAYRKRPNRAIFKPAIPLLIATIPAAMALYGFNAEFQRRNLVIICLTLGLLSSKVTNNLIIAHMTKSQVPLVDGIFAFPLVTFLFAVFCRDFLVKFDLIDEFLLLLCTAFCLLNLIWSSQAVCMQIAKFLDIKVFSIPTRTQPSTGTVAK